MECQSTSPSRRNDGIAPPGQKERTLAEHEGAGKLSRSPDSQLADSQPLEVFVYTGHKLR
jgi:hypothetical protein